MCSGEDAPLSSRLFCAKPSRKSFAALSCEVPCSPSTTPHRGIPFKSSISSLSWFSTAAFSPSGSPRILTAQFSLSCLAWLRKLVFSSPSTCAASMRVSS